MSIIKQIRETKTQAELSNIVESYLRNVGEYDRSRGESYAETAGRLGGDAEAVLMAAECRWFDLE